MDEVAHAPAPAKGSPVMPQVFRGFIISSKAAPVGPPCLFLLFGLQRLLRRPFLHHLEENGGLLRLVDIKPMVSIFPILKILDLQAENFLPVLVIEHCAAQPFAQVVLADTEIHAPQSVQCEDKGLSRVEQIPLFRHGDDPQLILLRLYRQSIRSSCAGSRRSRLRIPG